MGKKNRNKSKNKPSLTGSGSLSLKPKWQHILLIVVLGFLVYSNALNNEFVYDDIEFVVNNEFIKNIDSIPAFFISKQAYSSEGTFYIYRPMASLSYAIDYIIWKLNPMGFHITNILFHLINSVLIFILLRIILQSNTVALIIALFFTLHPVQTEAVAWISGRSNVLFMSGFLMSFILYIKYSEDRKLMTYLLSLLFFIYALLSKEMAIILLPMIIIYDIYYTDIFNKSYKIINKMKYIPYISVSLVYLIIRQSVLGRLSQKPYWGDSIYSTMMTMTKVFVKYIYITILPIKLSVIQEMEIVKTIFKPEIILSSIILVFLIFLSVKLYKNERDLSFGISWFFITLIPVSNLIPIKALYAERLLYLPITGLLIVFVVLLGKIKNRRFFYIIVFTLLTLCFIRTTIRNNDWKDRVSLWDSAVKLNPFSAKAHNNRGVLYQYNKKYDKSLSCFNRAILLKPDFVSAYVNRGLFYALVNKHDRALKDYNKAIEIAPEFIKTYNNRGVVYGKKGFYNKAIDDFNKAIELNPKYSEAYSNRGLAYQYKGLYNQAISDFSEAIRLNPRYIDAYNNRSIAYRGINKLDLAEKDEEKARALMKQY